MHEFDFHRFSSDEPDYYWNLNYTTYNLSFNEIGNATVEKEDEVVHNWWALAAIILVVCTAAGNVLVCLAIYLERRLQNVTNYFLMSLAITDLLVAMLVMPLGILTLLRGYFPLPAVYCLVWICLDVLLCTASIMHLCTISVDRYLSLRYPMRFGRNKTRKRVTVKIAFVWILSTAMSLPLSLMYSKIAAALGKDSLATEAGLLNIQPRPRKQNCHRLTPGICGYKTQAGEAVLGGVPTARDVKCVDSYELAKRASPDGLGPTRVTARIWICIESKGRMGSRGAPLK
ncbi:5-hydroxytryptamine receptor 2C-like [Hyposmocoma kahamanoa]|uniref:5-hydroxytryptamine receptor 2C-like n=1 Tax=Hyposmocoma kahamanoa TaxID=1477025 RepID=UPI000E6D756A|nr:5-hydroxytryptamine receptor 2C-like [Hyposmocoma kahamanoa]